MSKRNATPLLSPRCPCGSGQPYAQCCELLHRGAPASSAEALMRSRYCAFVLNLHEYIQRSWHPSTRSVVTKDAASLDKTQWLGLQIKRRDRIDEDHALVEFIARYKIAGRAFRLHEVSRFVREQGHWFYLDGQQSD